MNTNKDNQSCQLWIGILGLIVAAIACVAAVIVIPEVRNLFGFDDKNGDALETQAASSGDNLSVDPTDADLSVVIKSTLVPSNPTSESLPTAPVPAGTPIKFDGWSLTVSREIIINSYYDTWGITIYVQNLSDTKRVFRFANSGVTATDNLGNTYEPSGEGIGISSTPCEAIYYEVKNLDIAGNQSESILSEEFGYNSCDDTDGIHMFQGPIPLDVSQLIIHFEKFGPFNDIDVVIDL